MVSVVSVSPLRLRAGACGTSPRRSVYRVRSRWATTRAQAGGGTGNGDGSALLSPQLEPLIPTAPTKLPFNILFTDLDGTCVHYTSPIGLGRDGKPTAILQLPPSKTGAFGVISVRTLQLYAVVRQLGVKLVLISGARLSTVLQRLPWLPAADAIVAESGGRIFFPGALPTAAPLQEDTEWRATLAAAGAGPAGQDAVPPEERYGTLWELYAAIKDGQVAGLDGAKLDATSYTTAFRMRLREPAQGAALTAALPPGLVTTTNLGAADVFPAASGKENAARHLMQRYGVEPQDCVFMCDDENDIQLANVVRRAYLPAISADAMRDAVAARPDHFYVSSSQGVWATEEILERLIFEYLSSSGSPVAPKPWMN